MTGASTLSETAAGRRGPWAALMVLAFAAALPSATFPPAADDAALIDSDPAVAGRGPLSDPFSRQFFASAGLDSPYYRPLVPLTWAAQARIGMGGSAARHVVDALLLAAITGLGACLVLRLTGDRAAALSGAALFALHPALAEVAALNVGRCDLLAAAGLLAAWLLALGFVERAPGRLAGLWLSASAAAALAAVLAKESALILPVVMGVALWLFPEATGTPKRDDGRRIRRLAAVALVWGAVFAAAALLRTRALGALLAGPPASPLDTPLAGADARSRVLTSVVVLAHQGVLALFPGRTSFEHGPNSFPAVTSLRDPRLIGAGVLVITAVWWMSRNRRTAGPGPRLVVLALTSLLPLLPLSARTPFLTADRLLFVPLVFACPAFSLGLRRWGGAAAVAAALTVSGVAWAARLADFSSPLRLAQQTVLDAPDSVRARYNLGNALQRQGRPAEAALHALAAVHAAPGWGGACNNAGTALAAAGQLDRALEMYSRAATLEPGAAASRQNLGALLLAIGRVEEALPHLEMALRLEPRGADAVRIRDLIARGRAHLSGGSGAPR